MHQIRDKSAQSRPQRVVGGLWSERAVGATVSDHKPDMWPRPTARSRDRIQSRWHRRSSQPMQCLESLKGEYPLAENDHKPSMQIILDLTCDARVGEDPVIDHCWLGRALGEYGIRQAWRLPRRPLPDPRRTRCYGPRTITRFGHAYGNQPEDHPLGLRCRGQGTGGFTDVFAPDMVGRIEGHSAAVASSSLSMRS